MAASTASSVTPVLAWDKSQVQVKTQRKKSNPLVVVAVAAIALLALSGVWRATHQAPPGQFIKVVTAGQDLPAGARLGFMKVKFLDVPKSLVTRDMVLKLDDVNDRVIRTFIPVGEPILLSDMFPGHNGLSVSLENDERALTLQLSDDALVDHSIRPDDRVDVLCTSAHDGKQYTKTICQDAKVLMAAPKEQILARHLGSSANNKITLAVTPQVAEVITEAAETGKLRVVLRNHLGRSSQHLLGAEPNDLLPSRALIAESIKAAKLSVHSELVPPPALPPMPPLTTNPPDEEDAGPVQWLVDVFTGSKKVTYGVPAK